MRNLWIFRFFGLHERKQEQTAQKVAEYVHDKKSQFTGDMAKLQEQARKAHRQAIKVQEHSENLVKITDDITARIAIVTKGRR